MESKAVKHLNRVLKKHNLTPSNYENLVALYEASLTHGEFDIQNIDKNILVPWATLGLKEDLVERYREIRKCGPAITLKKMLLIYGEKEGVVRWETYCEKQAESNTLEYKRKKHGWTEEQFNEYNKSRATTKESVIRRYGEEAGKIKWEEYVEKQRTNGCTKEWFIAKYGETAGTEFYLNLNRQKARSLENFVLKYGDEGEEKFKQYRENGKSCGIASKSANAFFDGLHKRLLGEVKDYQKLSVYFDSLNKEFVKYDPYLRRAFFFDFTIPSARVIIEYNGDLYHANPQQYSPSDVPPFPGNKKTAKEIWEADEVKRKVAEANGFHVIYVWEGDVKTNANAHYDRIIDEIRNRIDELRS